MEKFENELVNLWDVVCPKCHSEILNKNGKYNGRQRFICLDCGYSFTTYSKTLFNSTKIKKSQWDIIIDGIIQNKSLKIISSNSNISPISISKIKRKIYKMLNSDNEFENNLKRFYYNPFDNSSFFTPVKVKSIIYYYQYNDDSYILYSQNINNEFISIVYSKKEFNTLLTSIYYPNVEFINYKDILDDEAFSYIEDLLYTLKQYRGIKKNLLDDYSNFFHYRKYNTDEKLSKYIYKKITTYKIK